jgi:hypothetical protein
MSKSSRTLGASILVKFAAATNEVAKSSPQIKSRFGV